MSATVAINAVRIIRRLAFNSAPHCKLLGPACACLSINEGAPRRLRGAAVSNTPRKTFVVLGKRPRPRVAVRQQSVTAQVLAPIPGPFHPSLGHGQQRDARTGIGMLLCGEPQAFLCPRLIGSIVRHSLHPHDGFMSFYICTTTPSLSPYCGNSVNFFPGTADPNTRLPLEVARMASNRRRHARGTP